VTAEVDAPPPPLPQISQPFGDVSLQDPIHFAHGSAVISDASAELIRYVGEVVANSPAVRHVVIIGYASQEGSDAYNATLSMNRALNVFKALVAAGAKPQNLSINGRGETPQDAGRDRGLDRRVELQVLWSRNVQPLAQATP
jgi:outer membrane protein OmpA-like peptidoglycan-associated protein